ncbi:MAG TPA: 1-acyl-sn-glycerol-3-phosphate acyltransferase [Gallionellaceae bacterium]|nr:1-acyl-sn-glycerol-3-phosphate acyltransferase [Gallionellaceae bacterium]
MSVRALLRGARLALHLAWGMLLALPYPHLPPGRQHRMLQSWSRQLLSILGVGVRVDGLPSARDGNACLIVANHVSWLDIFALNAVRPSRFVAKSEVRGWPLIGWLCRRTGTIFIDRDLRRNAATVNRHVAAQLERGARVSLFPEGTSTDGRGVGHFHSALIQPAIDAGVVLVPVALRYRHEDGGHCDAAAYVGDMTLSGSIWRILRGRRFDAWLTFAPALATAGENRRTLARAAQQAIAHELGHADAAPVPSGNALPAAA